MHVRLLSPDEWRVAREIRLAALRDAPEALLPRQPHESDWDEDRWRRSWENGLWAVAADAAGAGANGGAGGAGAGVFGVARLAREEAGPYVESVWTRPEHRRRGVARALVRELVNLEREHAAGDVFVWVIRPNPAALRLYTSLGFESTDTVQVLETGQEEERLRLSGALPPD
jgi:GNAT superfamily N-acetyltransferase